MLLQLQKKIYKIPPPICNEAEKILKVEKYSLLSISDKLGPNIFNIQHRYAKLLFFLLHEGIRLTLNKVRTSILQKKINSEKHIVFVYGQEENSNNYAIALGPQDCPFSEYLVFPKILTLNVESQRDIQNDYKIISQYFKHNPEKLKELYDYSVHSEKTISFNLKSILEDKINDQDKKANTEHILQTLDIPGEKIYIKSKKHSNIKEYDLFLAGMGTYARSYILPNLKNVNFHTIIDYNPLLSSVIGEKYGFIYKDTSYERALVRLEESLNPILVIATYHSTHTPIAEYALSINPQTKIFIEKPPATTTEQLRSLINLRNKPTNFVEIGYNRRYSPFIVKAKEIIGNFNKPITMTCIVKELNIPLSHWYYWPNQKSRITGNLCHWIDLGIFFIQSIPESIIAISASKDSPGDENSVIITFKNGSLLTLIASNRGNQLRGVQEYIEIRCEDLTIKIEDFLKMKVLEKGLQKIYRKIIRDKGHKKMYENFLYNLKNGENTKYPNEDLFTSTTLYLSISDMLLSNIKYRTILLDDQEKVLYI